MRRKSKTDKALNRLITSDKVLKGLIRDLNKRKSKPIVSIGPSGIGGPYQKER